MSPHRHTLAAALAIATTVAIACSAAKTNDPTGGDGGAVAVFGPPPAGHGQLAVELVDAPAQTVDAIVVNVTSVTAHAVPGGWITLTKTPPGPIDLLQLADPAAALPLGFANLPAATITQIRLLVAKDGNHVTVGKDEFPLKVPSGYESGIKIHGPWEVTTCGQTSVTLDFDGNKSIWYHPTGHGDDWVLRPVIHGKKSRTAPIGCDDGGQGGGTVPPSVACDLSHPCGAGLVCAAGACVGGSGAACGAGPECASGVCAEHSCGGGGFSSPCSADRDCLSGVCGGGACTAGAAGDPCRAGTDCASGACTEGSCGNGPAADFGAACQLGSDCLSNSCSSENSTCEAGDQGKPCNAPADCAAELVCSGGYCTAQVMAPQ